jgi:hypothetical protein
VIAARQWLAKFGQPEIDNLDQTIVRDEDILA